MAEKKPFTDGAGAGCLVAAFIFAGINPPLAASRRADRDRYFHSGVTMMADLRTEDDAMTDCLEFIFPMPSQPT